MTVSTGGERIGQAGPAPGGPEHLVTPTGLEPVFSP